jgi:hypothetical protein
VEHQLSVCRYDLTPASPADSTVPGSRKAAALHAMLGDAFYSQMLGALTEFKSCGNLSDQAESKARIVRAAEMAVTHRCAEGCHGHCHCHTKALTHLRTHPCRLTPSNCVSLPLWYRKLLDCPTLISVVEQHTFS